MPGYRTRTIGVRRSEDIVKKKIRARLENTLEKFSVLPSLHADPGLAPSTEGKTPHVGASAVPFRGGGGCGTGGGVGLRSGRKLNMQPSLHSKTGSLSMVSHELHMPSE